MAPSRRVSPYPTAGQLTSARLAALSVPTPTEVSAGPCAAAEQPQHAAERGLVDRARHLLPAAFAGDQAGGAQLLEMMRHGRQRQLEVLGDGAHGVAFAVGAATQAVLVNALEDGQAIGIGERPKGARDVIVRGADFHFDTFRSIGTMARSQDPLVAFQLFLPRHISIRLCRQDGSLRYRFGLTSWNGTGSSAGAALAASGRTRTGRLHAFDRVLPRCAHLSKPRSFPWSTSRTNSGFPGCCTHPPRGGWSCRTCCTSSAGTQEDSPASRS